MDFSISSAAAITTGTAAAAADGRQDVVLEFTGLIDSTVPGNRTFIIKVNGELVEEITGLAENVERTHSIVLRRSVFSAGVNEVTIETFHPASRWGIKDITAKLLPEIELELGVRDGTAYGTSGSSDQPPRYTGATFTFNLDDASPLTLELTSSGMSVPDEMSVFINGKSIGNLNYIQGNAGGIANKFIIDKSDVVSGKNTIEFLQREPGSNFSGDQLNWSIEDVVIDIARPDLDVIDFEIVDEKIKKDKVFQTKTTVQNIGDIPSVLTRGLQLHLSPDQTITPSDRRLGFTFVMSKQDPAQIKNYFRGAVTDMINEGYYIGVCVTDSSTSTETIVFNNCSQGIPLEGIGDVPLTPIIMLLMDDELESLSEPETELVD